MLYIGARRSLLKRRGNSAPIWTPAANFPLGTEPGLWYDPSSFTGLYQDSAGTSPATAVGQPNGLMLDKRRGLVLGPELVVNGDFSAGASGWTLTGSANASSGALVVNSTAYENFATQSLVGFGGKFVRIKVTITVVSGAINVFVGGLQLGGVPITTSRALDQYVYVGSSESVIRLRAEVAFVGTIGNISVKELPGNHISQATASARPIINNT